MSLSYRGLLRAASAVSVPATEVPLLLWTKQTYGELHPVETAKSPPTISGALGDPIVAGPFGVTIILIAVLLVVSLVFIVRAYNLSIKESFTDSSRQRYFAGLLLVLIVLMQAAGTLGMMVTSVVSMSIDRDIHMASSYIFFGAQSGAILGSGALCSMLARASLKAVPPSSSPVILTMRKIRVRAAMAICLAAIVYLILFCIKDVTLPIDDFIVRQVYTIWEMILLIMFVLYVGLFAPDLYWIEHIRSLERAGEQAVLAKC